MLSSQPLDSVLVLEISPGTEQAIGLIRSRAFAADDRMGVIGFNRTAQVLQPLTEDRDEFADALHRAGIRVGVGINGTPRNPISRVDLVAALKMAYGELGERGTEEAKRAILVFFSGEDPNLSSQFDALKARLSAAHARLYAVVIQRVAEPNVRLRAPTSVDLFPVMTAQLMSELAAESGGRIFRRNWDLKEILKEARKP